MPGAENPVIDGASLSAPPGIFPNTANPNGTVNGTNTNTTGTNTTGIQRRCPDCKRHKLKRCPHQQCRECRGKHWNECEWHR